MKKSAFIRIPKTGSTSFAYSIQNSNNIVSVDHSYCYKVDNKNTGWIWSKDFPYFNPLNYDKIYTLIRNPFDVLISYYHHNYKNFLYPKKICGWCACNIVHGFNSWEEFLESYINPNFKWHLPPMKKSLFSMAYDKKDNLIIDRYFKVESPNNINNFLSYYNYPSLKTLNVTIKEQKQYYTMEQVNKLNKIWERDLKYFNYKYEGQ